MRARKIAFLAALVLCMGVAFYSAITVSGTGANTPPSATSDMPDGDISIPAVATPLPSDNPTETTFNPVATEPAASGIPSESESAISEGDNVFTPDGTGTVVDIATDADGKLFYTIVTPADNVFYLVIDMQRSDGSNVYFLNAVTESDLAALAEKDGGSTGESAVPTPEPEPTPEPTIEPTPEPEPVKEKGGMGTMIFIVVAVIAVGGAGFYMKIIRPKQQAAFADTDEEDEYMDDDIADYGDDEYLPEDE